MERGAGAETAPPDREYQNAVLVGAECEVKTIVISSSTCVGTLRAHCAPERLEAPPPLTLQRTLVSVVLQRSEPPPAFWHVLCSTFYVLRSAFWYSLPPGEPCPSPATLIVSEVRVAVRVEKP